VRGDTALAELSSTEIHVSCRNFLACDNGHFYAFPGVRSISHNRCSR